MFPAVADTHTALWYLYGDHRLSSTAKSLIDHTAALGLQIGISSISLAELVYLIEKSRLPPKIPRADIPNMPDQLIAATAASLGVPLISRDGQIRASAV